MTARDAALNMVDRLRDVDGIFAPAAAATTGMLRPLRKEKLTGKVTVVGSDTSSYLREGLRRGEVHALLVQDPRRMGYLGLSTLVKYLNGQQVPARPPRYYPQPGALRLRSTGRAELHYPREYHHDA